MIRFPVRLSLTAIIASAVSAQNEIRYTDPFVASFAGRGNIPFASAATLLQRLPADQVCRPGSVTGFTTTLQCSTSATAQQFFYELRLNNPAGAATGTPDTAGGALGVAGPFTFPASTSTQALLFTVTFSTPIPIGARPVRVPAGDIYAAVVVPAPVPGNAPLLMHMNANEPMRANAIGYTGQAGVAGLAWSVVTGLGNPAVVAPNVVWALGTRVSNDACQPFARRGGSDNVGYAGLFPDTAAGDQPGWRVRATASTGSPSLLLLSAGLLSTPVPVAGVGGFLCLDPTLGILMAAIASTGPGPGLPAGTTQATFGPFPTGLSGGVDVFAQTLTLDAVSAQARLSTACRVNF